MTITTYMILFAGVLGLIVGSFLNVVALRSPKRLFWSWTKDAIECLHEHAPQYLAPEWRDKNDEVYDRFDAEMNATKPHGIAVKSSHCFHCQKDLRWYHNIPVLSYLFLKGKCGHCKTPISMQYPLVELSMGVLGVLAVYTYGATPLAIFVFLFFAVLLVLTVIDFRTQYLPDNIVLPSLWAALLLSLTPWGLVSPEKAIMGAIIGYLSLWSVYWIFKLVTKKEGMGYGDFKLLALIGAFLGPDAILPVVLISSVVGAIVGVGFLAVKKKSAPFAFGPYLALAGIIYTIFAGLYPGSEWFEFM